MTFYSEILKDVVPTQLIQSNPRRFLEGSRLLFGLILEKAKQIKLKGEGVQLPYLSSISVLDLRNAFSMEPIVNVVGTSVYVLGLPSLAVYSGSLLILPQWSSRKGIL